MPARYAIGVDLGGTKIATGITNFSGNILARRFVPTHASEGETAVIARIKESIRHIMDDIDASLEEVAGIGICCPGPLNPETGVVIMAPNLNWSHVPIVSHIVEEFGIPTFLENDANAAALAEKWFGAGQDVDSLLYITVSTGVGGGIILNGDIYRGRNHMAGEIGHAIVQPEGGVQCGCGQYGCLETISSGTAIGREAQNVVAEGGGQRMAELAGGIDGITAKTVADAAAEGDPDAEAILERAFMYLGTFVVSMLNILNVEKIVIGGGVSKLGDNLFEPVRRVVGEKMSDVPAKYTPIVPAETGDNVGILGAVGLVVKSAFRAPTK